jgi:hypothetical protein
MVLFTYLIEFIANNMCSREIAVRSFTRDMLIITGINSREVRKNYASYELFILCQPLKYMNRRMKPLLCRYFIILKIKMKQMIKIMLPPHASGIILYHSPKTSK